MLHSRLLIVCTHACYVLMFDIIVYEGIFYTLCVIYVKLKGGPKL